MTDDLAAFLDAAEVLAVPPPRVYQFSGTDYIASPYVPADVPPLVAMVRAVLARCDSYERSGYPDALITKGKTIAEFRAALLSAIPPTPTAEETR
jgi:hypothetical protein